ncbi:hypothetical protein [Pseudoalteromonas sp.]|uniref:hypothetical protein n=1 Tax=Pseudoalteromonas sp. TaxID=53249 RepID=UPI00272D2948|nr:hypothetical protein [Pseudoalteromonas sp.]
MNNSQLINQSVGESGFDYYTPPEISDLARDLMGSIDLDPASSSIANQNVKADKFFTILDDGLKQEWSGRVFMNHPFHRGEKACEPKCKKLMCKRPTKKSPNRRGHCITEDIPSNNDWINKLLDSYNSGKVTEAVIITFASTSEDWFWPLLDYPKCYPKGRVHYYKPNGERKGSATKGSVITYIGPNVKRFAQTFSRFGKIHVPYQ